MKRISFGHSQSRVAGTALAVVCTMFFLGCEDRTLSPPHDGALVHPSLSVTPGTWPNEPAGFASLDTDDPFQVASAWDVECAGTENGWDICDNLVTNGQRHFQLVTLADAPYGSTQLVGRFTYDSGFVGGGAPASTGDAHLAAKSWHRVYAATWWKASNPWQGHPSGVNKIAFLWTMDDATMILKMQGQADGSYKLYVATEHYFPDATYVPNVNDDTVAIGTWHLLELSADIDAQTVQWWLDGLLQGSYSNVGYPQSAFRLYQLSPTWGGAEPVTKVETDYFWYDHVHVSGPSWPNEPTGLAAVSDHAFNDSLIVSGETPISDGWVLHNANGYAARVIDATAPFSPVNTGRITFPSGLGGGDAPATFGLPLNNLTEFYVGVWWKPSSPWEHSSGINNIEYIQTNQNDLVGVRMLEVAPDTFRIGVSLQLPGIDNSHLANQAGDNLLGATIQNVALGAWHRVEVHVKLSTSSSSRDGVVEWWLDGTQIGSYANVNFNPADLFTLATVAPVWGGIGETKAETDYFWFDHVRVSGR